jgi:hypothetical protein
VGVSVIVASSWDEAGRKLGLNLPSGMDGAQKDAVRAALAEFLNEQGAIAANYDEAGLLVGRVTVQTTDAIIQVVSLFSVLLAAAIEPGKLLTTVPAVLGILRSLFKAVSVLQSSSGDLCVYRAVVRIPQSSSAALSGARPRELLEYLSCKAKAPHPEDCRFWQRQRCRIAESDVNRILKNLQRKGLVRQESERWSI